LCVPQFSEAEAIAKVFHDDHALYERYRRASAGQSATSSAVPPARLSPAPSGAEAEALKRADSLVRKDARLTPDEALSRVFHDDPALYAAYRKQAGASAPTFAATFASTQMGALADAAHALLRTIDGILASDAADQGARIAQALDAFGAAVLAHLQAAGLDVAAKRAAPPHPLAGDILTLAKLFSPSDQTGAGMLKVKQALGLLQETVQRRRVAA
jgi:hypothetical protein